MAELPKAIPESDVTRREFRPQIYSECWPNVPLNNPATSRVFSAMGVPDITKPSRVCAGPCRASESSSSPARSKAGF